MGIMQRIDHNLFQCGYACACVHILVCTGTSQLLKTFRFYGDFLSSFCRLRKLSSQYPYNYFAVILARTPLMMINIMAVQVLYMITILYLKASIKDFIFCDDYSRAGANCCHFCWQWYINFLHCNKWSVPIHNHSSLPQGVTLSCTNTNQNVILNTYNTSFRLDLQ